MKNIKSIIFFLVLNSSLFAQENNFELNGSITGDYNDKIYLFFDGHFKQKDSIVSIIKGGRFFFQGKIKEPTLGRLHLGGLSIICDIYLEKGKMFVTCIARKKIDNIDTLNVLKVVNLKGSNSEYFKNRIQSYLLELDNSTKNQEEKDKLHYQKLLGIVRKYPKNKVVPYLISNESKLSYSQIQSLYNLFDSSLYSTYEVKEVVRLLKSLNKDELSKIGSNFHDVSVKDTNDNLIETRQLRGKYVLMVCWASWCVPCRKEHPALNSIYEKYKGQEFEMLGISLDKLLDREKWIQAIADDKLYWLQGSSLNGFESEIAKFYGIDGIPFNLLIDKTGKIIGKNLQLNEVNKILGSIFQSTHSQ